MSWVSKGTASSASGPSQSLTFPLFLESVIQPVFSRSVVLFASVVVAAVVCYLLWCPRWGARGMPSRARWPGTQLSKLGPTPFAWGAERCQGPRQPDRQANGDQAAGT